MRQCHHFISIRLTFGPLLNVFLVVSLFSLSPYIAQSQGQDSCTESDPEVGACKGDSPIEVNAYEPTNADCTIEWCFTREYCNNCCEQCCLYEFEIINHSPLHQVMSIGLCTDLGCSAQAGPTSEVYDCNAVGVRPYTSDHICTYCGNTLIRNGASSPNAWREVSFCPNGLVYPNRLCAANCIYFNPIGTANSLGSNDRVRFRIGLTGDCIDRMRNTDNGLQRRKCVWVCVRFDDGSEACCLVLVRHCMCVNDPTFCSYCPQSDCTDENEYPEAYLNCYNRPGGGDPPAQPASPSPGTMETKDR